jgi:hypothetical protein
MRRKLKTLKAKGGHSENGAPRQMIDEALYREFLTIVVIGRKRRWDPAYSGWSNARRPQDQPISLRALVPNPG